MLRKLIIIAGPTGIGKTQLGINVARTLAGEVISADSRQLYRYMNIGTAKPDPLELAEVKHHGLNLKDPDERTNAGQFVKYARTLCEGLWQRGVVPVMVGGTGLYIQAFLDGLWAEESQAEEIRATLEERLQAEGLSRLYDELGSLDPVAQSWVAARDTQRVLRALELALTSNGKRGIGAEPFDCIPLAFCLHRERAELNHRLDLRVDNMMEQGLMSEVEGLLARGYHRQTFGLQSMGYQELLDFSEGRCSRADALARIKLRTRQYAKRQVTWFRKDRRYRWLDLGVWGLAGASESVLAQFRNHSGF